MAYIVADDLKYRYPDSADLALKGLNFTVEKGEFIGIAGENNSGKSTLCQAFAGLAPNFYKGAYGGKLTIGGLNPASAANSEICTKIGLVFQNPYNQFSGAAETVFEEIAFGLQNIGIERSEMIRRIEEVMVLLDIADYKDRNPFDLSGGQQQRVALAGVLAMSPEVLVLDEPTSQLDPKGTSEVFGAVEKLAGKGITIIMAEHKTEKLAEYCDRIMLLKEGEIAAFDTPERVFSAGGLKDLGIAPPVYTTAAKKLGKRDKEGYYPVTLAGALNALNGEIPEVIRRLYPKREQKSVIRLENIGYSYKEGVRVIEGLNLEIDLRPTAIIGQNGAGKTTLAKLIKGLIKPTNTEEAHGDKSEKKGISPGEKSGQISEEYCGDILLYGESTLPKTAAALSSKIGYVFQNPDDQIFKNTVLAEVMFGPLNIGFSKQEALEMSLKALDKVHLEGSKDMNPYDLSLSERKLVAIASVLAMDTDVIILDEPTIAQDSQGKQRIAEVIKELCEEGKAVIAILHDMDFVARCFERVIVMAKGKILAEGFPEDIFYRGEVLEAAGLEPPHIAILMQRLGGEGRALTVDDLKDSGE